MLDVDESLHMNIEVRRYSLKYEPPTLIIEYRLLDNNKTFHRRIRFKGAQLGNSSPEKIAEKVIRKNADILSISSISFDQLVDMVTLLLFSNQDDDGSIEHRIDDNVEDDALIISKQVTEKNTVATVTADVTTLFGDLNKVSEEENRRAKDLMSINFEKNRLKHGDHDFEYDKRIDFGDPVEENDWDE